MNESRTERDYQYEDLIKRERLQSGIHTPILDNIRRIETYGNLTPAEVKKNIYDVLVKMRREPYIIGVIGEPESGKTSLASELVMFARTILEREKPDAKLNRFRIKSFDFEDAQKIASSSGYERDLKEHSETTRIHYERSNKIFRAGIRNAMTPGSLLIVHAPGMIERGNMEALTQHSGEFSGLQYNADFVLVTKGRGIEARATKIRTAYKMDPRSRHEHLTLAGMELDLEEGYASSISGGNIDAVNRFYRSLARHFADVYHQFDLPEELRAKIDANPVDFFMKVTNRASIMEQFYGPWLFGEKLGVNMEDTLIGRNNVTNFATLYQDDLNATNYFMGTSTEYDDVKWY